MLFNLENFLPWTFLNSYLDTPRPTFCYFQGGNWVCWPEIRQELSNKFEPKRQAKHLMGLEPESLQFWMKW